MKDKERIYFDYTPNWEDYATIESYCGGEPVYSLGNIAYIYGVSPDLLPDVVLQYGNTNPVSKIKPKKSWELSDNLFGAYMTQPSARSPWNDNQALLPVHLIDGDPDTAWCSFGCQVSDGRPEWIRIDLPRETEITKIVLVGNLKFAMGNCTRLAQYNEGLNYKEGMLTDWQGFHRHAGHALPRELSIQISCDAWHWDTVYETKCLRESENHRTEVTFAPRFAKQIIINANNFKHRLDKYVGYAFSISGVEIHDSNGNNVALISKGATVSVSSTAYLFNHDRITQSLCHGPVQYDIGFKWTNITADDGMHCWQYVEKEKGKFEVDPEFDDLVSEMRRNGLKIIMDVDVKANPIYQGRKIDWRSARIREISNSYYDNPCWAWNSPEMWDAYVKYVAFIVNHFKDRVAVWGMGADWPCDKEKWDAILKIIKQNAPDTEIRQGIASSDEAGKKIVEGVELTEEEKAMLPNTVLTMPGYDGSQFICDNRVDAGWGIKELPGAFIQMKEKTKRYRDAGFKGTFETGIMTWSMYPPGPRGNGEADFEKINDSSRYFDLMYYCDSETVHAKTIAQTFIGCAGLGIRALFCNPYFSSCSSGQGLFRVSPSQVLNSMQPISGYYVLRTICTVMDGWQAIDFDVECKTEAELQEFTFKRGNNEFMYACWIPGTANDGITETAAELIFPGVKAKKAWVIDLMNGTEQSLDFTVENGSTVLKQIMVKDYPVLICLKENNL